jgi:hypothetical protein
MESKGKCSVRGGDDGERKVCVILCVCVSVCVRLFVCECIFVYVCVFYVWVCFMCVCVCAYVCWDWAYCLPVLTTDPS